MALSKQELDNMFGDDLADEDLAAEMALDPDADEGDGDGDIEFQDDWIDDDGGEVGGYLNRGGVERDIGEGGLREMGTRLSHFSTHLHLC